ncbi:hypothetical protein [Streptacidiphilus jiangxiensis]|uniref:Uncharacterized protein n=1 Tax=Streptacidiphilus jiangxiensis TaxID=235985 RepID=A0A1H8A786_STRJI|nr:hypothetical protein [Streptacidiphilus jiangxiensis]SEM65754.1 hypothetical protein SAMN05414137_14115 [Streptacidiphilus jiangxiensis]
MRVDHALVLARLDPLNSGTVTGRQQTLHLPDAGLTVTADLAQSIRADTYPGVRVRIISLQHGVLDTNVFGFTEHGTFTNAEESLAYGERAAAITLYNQDRVFQPDRCHPDRLRDAIRTYITAFTGLAPAPAPAPTPARQDSRIKISAPAPRTGSAPAARSRR